MDFRRNDEDELPEWTPAPSIWRTALRVMVGICLGALGGVGAWTVAERVVQVAQVAHPKAVIEQAEAPKLVPAVVEQPQGEEVQSVVTKAAPPAKPGPVLRDVSTE